MNTQNLTFPERVTLTLRLASKTMYESGFCGKLMVYAKHAKELLTSPPEDASDIKPQLDALDLFVDFIARFETKRIKSGDFAYVSDQINASLKSN